MTVAESNEERIVPIDPKSLPRRFDVREREVHWRTVWDDLGVGIPNRDLPRGRNYVIDSPPPTASGSLHPGHVFSYTHQDLIARYRRMTGWNVIYPMGWDDNGLPTERRVQNYFNVRTDPTLPYIDDLDVDARREELDLDDEGPLVISRANFIELCHIVTQEDEIAYQDLFRRLGFSIDWSEEYATIDDRCRRISQRSFLDLHAKGHVYSAELPTMWDVDFQTAVAQAEVEDRATTGAYHDIEFGVYEAMTGEDLELPDSFVISTTRPELIPACVGVTAHPDDARYQGLFGKHAVTPGYFAKVPIFPSDKADPEKGTGVLMICTFGDEADVEWWRRHGLELRPIVSWDGTAAPRKFVGRDEQDGWQSLNPKLANSNYQRITGKRMEDVRFEIVEMMRDKGNSAHAVSNGRIDGRVPLQSEPRTVEHVVRYYEKGSSPIEYLPSRQWFVRLMDKKDLLQRKGAEVNWLPDFMLKRYANWTDGLAHDWAISRQRYFGVPIPVWYRLDSEGKVKYDDYIIAEEDQLPVDPMTDLPLGYSESQRGMPDGFIGEQDVFDTWFTSSLTPQIVARWGDPDDRMDQLFPMDLRPQAHEIIRTWAFYTIVKAALHHNDIPWRDAMISGFIVDPDRKKMSKSRGVAITPLPLIEKYGADAVRFWSANGRLGTDMAFDESVFSVGTKLVTKLYNAGKFVLMQSARRGQITRELDMAFVADLRDLAWRSTELFERYEFANALQVTNEFFWGSFADDYIELVKRRARSEDDAEGRTSAVETLRLGLNVLLRLFAPFVPTITEEVWSWTFAQESGYASIHQTRWPMPVDALLVGGQHLPGLGPDRYNALVSVPEPASSDSFGAASRAIAAVRKAKADAGIRLGAPLESLELRGTADALTKLAGVEHDVANAGGATALARAEADTKGPGDYIAVVRAKQED